ncbi:cold shock domain-containing protein [Streptomyces sp. SID5606]|uniref:cold-shock protein n=1 Tax=Streptomyces sp. SID5606 TaxID=2690305 RepID=UPI001368A25C|nr:cold shock domain-containing protein [Streptomyces sp. SID5606]MZD52750.1 cold shock domain-containing protein [Streptomyces sp. SID5606]
MAVGRVVRFDGVRGYGFIAPEGGGEDVFLHANDLLIPETSVRTGAWVEFDVEEGDRGLKASSVQLAEGAPVHAAPQQAPAPVRPAMPSFHEAEEPTCDVLGAAEFSQEMTELMLSAAPSMSGEQILRLRQRLVEYGRKHGWVEG